MREIDFLFDVYKKDEEFRNYVNKYCKSYNTPVFSALKHKQIHQYYDCLMEKRNKPKDEFSRI